MGRNAPVAILALASLVSAVVGGCTQSTTASDPSSAVTTMIESLYVRAELPTMTADAELIVRGTVVDQRSEVVYEPSAGQRYVVIVSTVSVSHAYKGASGATVEVVTVGGNAGGIETLADGEAQLVIGDTYVLFLGKESVGTLVTWGGAQGAAHVGADGSLTTRYPVAWRPTTLADLEFRLADLGIR